MEVLKNVFGSEKKAAKKAKRKSGSGLPNRSSVSGVDVPRVRSSSSSSCIQESEREGFVFVERLKEGNSTSEITSSTTTAAPLSPSSAASATSPPPPPASTSASTDVNAALAARLSDLDVRRVAVEEEAVQRTSPAHAAAAAAASDNTDNFLTLKNVKGGFCLDKKLEGKVLERSSRWREEEEPWLRPKLDLDHFDYDFTLEKSVLRDLS